MKRYFTFALALCFCMALSAQNLFVGTYNIRNHNSSDDSKGNVWTKRCQVICDQLNFEDPDIFGTQEVLVGQLHDLLKGLDGYGYVGVGRDDGLTSRCSDGTPPACASARGASSVRRRRASASITSISTWTTSALWLAARLPSWW